MIYLPSILLSVPRNPVTALGLPLALGMLSGYPDHRTAAGAWYKGLYNPPGAPPSEVYPVVWPILYLCMGYASHLAVKAMDNSISPATRSDLALGLTLYYGQLTLNCLWSTLFFRNKQVGLALIDSALMAGTTFYMTQLFDGPTNGKSTYFLLPYAAWLSYATYLNGGIWYLNQGRRLEK